MPESCIPQEKSRPTILCCTLLSLFLWACHDAGSPGGSGSVQEPAVIDSLVPVGDTRLWVHAEGRGDPLVVVHGGPLLDHSYLAPALRPLGSDLRLVYFDQRLSGRSDGRVDSASVRLDTFVDDIERLRDALDLGRIHLLGHSWGGLLAMKYGLRYPERLRSLILVSPMPPSAALWAEEQRALAASTSAADTAGMGELRAFLAGSSMHPDSVERLLRMSFRAELFDPAVAEELDFVIPGDYADRSRQFSRLGGDLTSYDVGAELEGLRVPTLVVYGEAEGGREIGGEALRRALPRVRFHVIPRAGHFSFRERPELFREVVRGFLQDTLSDAPGSR